MKLSTLGLGFAVAASSFAGISSISQSVSAATIGAQNGTFSFVGDWEFTFLYSFGAFQSTFGIEPSPTLFTELTTATPGVVTPSSSVTYTFTGSEENFFLSTETPTGTPKILSTTAHTANVPAGFLIVNSLNEALTLAAFPNITSTPDAGASTFASFFGELADGSFLIAVNDTFTGDSDYNDFIVKAKAVPVPAIVPGIALAGAFFGSKALKRKKDKASA